MPMLHVCGYEGCETLTLGGLCIAHEPPLEERVFPRGRPFAPLEAHRALELQRFLTHDPEREELVRGARELLVDRSLVVADVAQSRFIARTDLLTDAEVPRGSARVIEAGQDMNVDRHIEFLYEWTEVPKPAEWLLSHPPRLAEEYPGEAVMTREGAGWKVKSLRAQDFEEPMAHLQQAASGVLK